MYYYKSYLNERNSISFEESEEIYERILAEINFKNSDAKELYDDLIDHVLQYAGIRSKWLTFTREERMDKDQGRTMKHNSVISSFNVLSRYLEKIDKDISWRSQLGNERMRIGDFACYIAFIYGLNGR